MTRNIATTTLVIVFAATLVMSIAATAGTGTAECSFARAAGTYGFSTNGTVVGVGPRVSAGRLTLDADGKVLNGVATSSLNGTIFPETFSGTYTVNSDCTITISVEIFSSGTELFAVTASGAFDDNMREIRFIFTSVVAPNGTSVPVVIVGEARKMVP